MSHYVQRLNAAGLTVFTDWLISESVSTPPLNILVEPQYSEQVEGDYLVDVDRAFPNTFLLGKYLHEEVFNDVGDLVPLYRDAGMWSWLSLAFIGCLVRKQSAGSKPAGTPLAANHYVQDSVDGQRQAYRLIIRSTWWMSRIHGDAAAVVLSSPDSPWGELAEQVIGRQQIASHKGFFAIARHLYLNVDGSLKKGAAGQRTKAARKNPKAKSGLGAMRRLALTLNQFGRTYNTRVIQPEKMLTLLPKEYERWTV